MVILYIFLIALFIIFPFLINLHSSEKGISRWKKLDIFWWFKNDDDPMLPVIEGQNIKNDWYLPTKPQWYRVIAWGIRNPLSNYDRYIMGFWDKQAIWGIASGDGIWPESGVNLKIYLPFISFNLGGGFRGYIGWKPNGEFAFISIRRN